MTRRSYVVDNSSFCIVFHNIIIVSTQPRSLIINKKVLLRERKRHTASRAASRWPGGGMYLGVSPPSVLTWLGGGGRYLEVPPVLTWLGGGGRYLEVPPCPDLAGGRYLGVHPPPHPPRGQTRVKTLLYRRTTYAGGNNTSILVLMLLRCFLDCSGTSFLQHTTRGCSKRARIMCNIIAAWVNITR